MRDLRDDLVRRGDVMDELVKEYNRRRQEGGLKLAWIEKAVDSARPVEDVRPVVTCIECKRYGICVSSYVDPEFFCADGEKREDE